MSNRVVKKRSASVKPPLDNIEIRFPGNEAMAQAIRKLVEGLSLAEKFTAEVHEHSERAKAALALEATIDFLGNITLPERLVLPLIALQTALRDLELGTLTAITRPSNKGAGRPPTASMDNLTMLLCALAMEQYLKAKLDVNAASARFKRLAQKAGLSVSPQEALRWRSDIKGVVKGEQLYQLFEKYCAAMPIDPNALKEHADNLIIDFQDKVQPSDRFIRKN